MLVGYVSDENFVALADVAIEFDQLGETRLATHSTARGGIHADLPSRQLPHHPLPERLRLEKRPPTLPTPEPHQFRLLSDGLLGYMWPKWVKLGGEIGVPTPLHRTIPSLPLALWSRKRVHPHPRLARRAWPPRGYADHPRW